METLKQALKEYARAAIWYNEAKAELAMRLAPHKAKIKEIQAAAIGQSEKDMKKAKGKEYGIVADTAADIFISKSYSVGHRFSESGVGYVDVTPQDPIVVVDKVAELLKDPVARAFVESVTLSPAAAMFINGGGVILGTHVEEQKPKIRVSVKEYIDRQEKESD